MIDPLGLLLSSIKRGKLVQGESSELIGESSSSLSFPTASLPFEKVSENQNEWETGSLIFDFKGFSSNWSCFCDHRSLETGKLVPWRGLVGISIKLLFAEQLRFSLFRTPDQTRVVFKWLIPIDNYHGVVNSSSSFWCHDGVDISNRLNKDHSDQMVAAIGVFHLWVDKSFFFAELSSKPWTFSCRGIVCVILQILAWQNLCPGVILNDHWAR